MQENILSVILTIQIPEPPMPPVPVSVVIHRGIRRGTF